jgi:hypothetical protein
VELVAEIECFADPMAELVIVETGKDPVPGIVRRGHEKTLPTIRFWLLDLLVRLHTLDLIEVTPLVHFCAR